MSKSTMWIRRAGLTVLSFSMALAMGPANTLAATGETATKFAVGDEVGTDRYVTSNTVNKLSSGAVESKVVSNSSTSNRQTIDFLCEIDMSDPTTMLVAGYGSDLSTYTGQTETLKYELVQTGTQAAYYEQATGNTVVAAMNADFFDMNNGAPTGALVINGKVYHAAHKSHYYFGVTKDGQAVISKDPDLSNLQMAVGGRNIMVQNGEVVPGLDDDYGAPYYTRCAIGIKANGDVLMMSAYGMNAPTSCGHTASELAAMMADAGCETALMLDGGGSVTYLSQYEGSDDLVCRNAPSDGSQRYVSSTILVVSTARATGEFDHASITPNNVLYTPDSQVTFRAAGVDAYGYEADLPASGLEWRLSEASASMGTIDAESGVFTSNGTVGDVTVELYYNDAMVGSTGIQIRVPDALAFGSSSMALTYNTESDLGLTATYQTQPVTLKDGDIQWTVTESTDNTLGGVFGAIGTFGTCEAGSGQDLTFTTNANKAYSGAATIQAVLFADNTVTAQASVEVGKQPVVAMDFEEVYPIGKVIWDANCRDVCFEIRGTADETSSNYTPVVTSSFANAYTTDSSAAATALHTQVGLNGSTYYLTATRGGNESGEYVTTADEQWRDIIRFGNGAFKLNYDFSGAVGIEGADFGFSKELSVDGSASAVGLWVYAPEGTPNLWLRMRIRVTTADGTSTVNTINFTQRGDTSHSADPNDYGGINWEGWKYVETDLSNYQGQGCTVTLLPGESVRVMYTDGKYGDTTNIGMGNRLIDGTYVAKADCKGWLLFDNLTIIYGNKTEDTTNPHIGEIYTGTNTSDLTALDGAVLTGGSFSVFAEMDDNEETDENATGLVTRQIEVDGKLVGTLSTVDQYGYMGNIGVANGAHTLTIYAKDENGNVSRKTISFTVQDAESAYPTIALSPEEGSVPLLGHGYHLNLTTDMLEQTSAVDTVLTIDTKFPVAGVTFHEDYADSTWEYAAGKLTIRAVRSAEAASTGEGAVAVIEITVPADVASGSTLSYTITSGQVTYVTPVEEGTTWCSTFGGTTQRVAVRSTYTMTVDTMVVGLDGTITVVDAMRQPAAGISVYIKNEEADVPVGTTGEDGTLTTDMLTQEVASWTLYAADGEGGYSFPVSFQSYASIGESTAPYYIELAAVDHATTSKNVTWMANAQLTAKTAQLQYSLNEDGSDAVTVDGTSKLVAFSAQSDINANGSVRSNSVKVTGLASGTTYTYRVGDGEHWSEWKQFTTASAGDSTSFFVLGDTQSEDDAKLNTIMNQINGTGLKYDFGIQTGDALENAGLYADWSAILDVFSDHFGSIDMMHVIGNHELFGDSTGTIAKNVFNLPNSNYYSVEYNNVYVATIGYTEDRAALREALNWLITDARASGCAWKILTLHQPPYYTNATGGNEFINQVVPAACQEAGINAVFSGHDHALARTNQLFKGEIDNEKGILYYICGSTGEKSYAISSQRVFDYETVFAKADQNYSAVYLTGTATAEEMTIKIYDMNEGVLDTYTLKSTCGVEGHQYIYDPEAETVTCSVCGKSVTNYTGEIKDAEDNEYYMTLGALASGWTAVGEETRYYDPETGIREEVTVTEDVATTCVVRGYKILTAASGATTQIRNENAPGHEYVEQEDGSFVCSVCQYKRIELSDCTITLPYKSVTYNGKSRTNYPVVKAPDGTELEGHSVDFYVNYEDNKEVGTAKVIVTAKSGYYANMSEYRGNYGGQVTLTFEIRPDLPTNVTAESGPTHVTLNWTAAQSAPTYLIQTYVDGEGWKDLAETEDCTYTVNDLTFETTYKYRIRTKMTVGEKTYASVGSTTPVTIATDPGWEITDCIVVPEWTEAEYNGQAQKPALTVNAADGTALVKDLDYTSDIEAATNVGSYTYTITGIGRYTGTIDGGTFAIVPQDLTDTAEAEAEDTVYDGVTKTAITVTDKYGNELTAGKDYEVSYSGNDSVGVAEFTATGKGNYTGSVSGTFTIEAADIADLNVKLDEEADLAYTGSEIRPAVIIGGLVEGEDFTVVYENNIELGTATVTVTGEGNVAGTTTLEFEIVPRDIAGSAITDGSTYSYNEEAIEADIDVVNEFGTILVEGVDYEIGEYANNVEAGTAFVTVTGIGNYTGSVEHAFEIQAADVKTMTVTIDPTEYVYNGTERKPKVTVTNENGKTLRSTSYTVEYVDNKNAGTAKVIVTGIGSYVGTVERSFVINPADLTVCTAELSYTSVAYNGTSKTPAVTVKTAKGTTLKKGTHYDVTYTNNRKVGTATVTVTGINNYAGTIEKTFEITQADIASCTVTLAAETHYADGKAYEPAVTVKTAKGTTLKNGVSYTVEYKNNVAAGTASAVITGIGNYTGSVTKTFKITATTPISKGTVALAYSTMTYTGEARTPAVTVKTAAGTTLKKDVNYTVTYKNNVNVGKATVTVKGIGKYSGTVTKTFTIRPDAPTGLKAVSKTANSVKISFTPSKSAGKYYVYVNGKYTAALGSSTTSYTIKNLSAGTAYTITVKAVKVVNSVNYYSNTAKLSVTTNK